MKKQIFIIFSSALLFFISGDFSSIFANIQTVPVSQLPSGQRDMYQTDLFTGGATYSYPIKVPKGTNDLTPNVSLSYNSSGSHDLSMQSGSGWELNRDYIQRDVNYTPGDTSDDKFKLHFQGAMYELVYNSTDGFYHTKIESHLKIQQFTTGGQNNYGIYWQVTTKDGTVYRFGYSTNSEVMCNGQSYDGYWDLDQVQDTHNNHIYYTYTQSSGEAYLSQIKYNNDQQREIDFTYVNNSYQHQVYTQGCNVTEANRLSTIQVKANSNLVHEYDLTYTAAVSGMPLLQSITEKGTDASSLPPTIFTYNLEATTWATTPAYWDSNNGLDADMRNGTMDVRLLDVNGDGLTDIVKVTWNGSSDTYQVYMNQGTTWNNQPQTWVNNAGINAHPSDYSTFLMDVNGDGLPDIVKATGCNGNSSTWYVYLNTGSSWNTTAQTWASSVGVPCPSQSNPNVELVDINGDNLPDIVYTYANSGPYNTWEVLLNTGTSWSATPTYWANDQLLDARFDKNYLRMADVNGDGLPDIVESINNGGPNNEWEVWLNTGSGFTSPQIWDNPIDANFDNGNVTLADVNGDGLPDIIKVINNGGPNNDQIMIGKCILIPGIAGHQHQFLG